jgi:hypothetical protein
MSPLNREDEFKPRRVKLNDSLLFAVVYGVA